MFRLLHNLRARPPRQHQQSSTASLSIPESRTVTSAEVLFPVVGASSTVNRVLVLAYPSSHKGTKSCPHHHIAEEVKRILGYARYQEGIDTVDMDVVVHFDSPDFDGQSYGLALALADKRARHGHETRQPLIAATGIVSHQGAISPVLGFAEKISLVANACPSGALFVFPRPHLAEHQSALDQLAAKGIALRPAANLGEIQDLWQPQAPDTSPIPTTSSWPAFLYGTAAGFLLVFGAMLFYVLISVQN